MLCFKVVVEKKKKRKKETRFALFWLQQQTN